MRYKHGVPTTLYALLVAAAFGQPGEARKLTFDEAIEASTAHPGHRGLADALEARRAGDAELGALANDPQLLVMPGYRWNPESAAGFEAQVQLSQSWNLAGLAGARRAAASKERAALAALTRADALSRRLEVAHRWIRLRTREQDLARVERERALAEALVKKLAAAAEAGVVLRADLVEAQAYAAEVRRTEVDLEGARVHAAFDLAEALGAKGASPIATAGAAPQPSLPDEAQWPELVRRARELPEARGAEMAALAARAQAEEADAGGGWKLQTQLAFQRESPTSYISWLGVGVTAPVFDGDRRSRAQAAAAASRAEARQRVAERDAGRTLALALHEVEHGRERLAVVTESLAPALRQLVELRERAFERGEGTAFELLRAQQRLLDAERAEASAQGELTWAEVEAWLLLATLEAGPAVARAEEDRP